MKCLHVMYTHCMYVCVCVYTTVGCDVTRSLRVSCFMHTVTHTEVYM